jgi:molybdopterin adenylyltransferase
MLRVAVITVSDRAAQGRYKDRSGPAICSLLRRAHPGIRLTRRVVPDDRAAIMTALDAGTGCDWIITTGGTGLGPRDVTPEATAAFCDRPVPGIAEALRAASLHETPMAMLGRGYAGQRGRTVIVNLPGSPAAARFCAGLLIQVMTHARSMMAGEGHA